MAPGRTDDSHDSHNSDNSTGGRDELASFNSELPQNSGARELPEDEYGRLVARLLDDNRASEDDATNWQTFEEELLRAEATERSAHSTTNGSQSDQAPSTSASERSSTRQQHINDQGQRDQHGHTHSPERMNVNGHRTPPAEREEGSNANQRQDSAMN